VSENAVALFRQFNGELDARTELISKQLAGTGISQDRFVYFAREAVSNMPKLLLCNRASLHSAILKACKDALLPDGREGVIVPRTEKGDNLACWQPMVHGIRKRAAHYGVIIDAKVVCKNDQFEWEEGLTPVLRHIPTKLTEDPGELIGCYAVFRRDGRVIHHEVMRKIEVMAVKAISKQQDGLLWGKFETEAWKKTVVRRGSKSVPDLPEQLQKVIERNDDDFQFNQDDDHPPLDITPDDDGRDPLADPDGTPTVDEAMLDASAPAEQPAKVTPMQQPSRRRAG